MTAHRNTKAIVALLALVVWAVPAPALADTLLSGYGGPGEGNQAILGSTLLNGPKGEGGSGGSGSAAEPGQPALVATGSGGSTGSKGANGSGESHGGQRAGAPGASTHGAPGASTRNVGPGSAAAGVFSSATVGGSQVLGLSGADALYLALAGVALAMTATVTRLLSRRVS